MHTIKILHKSVTRNLFISHVSKRSHHAVPKQPVYNVIKDEDLPKPTKIDIELVEQLERLALVDFPSEEAVTRLEEVIRYADRLQLVDTTNVEPMDSVLEDRALYLREDKVTEHGDQEAILSNAAKTFEGYFVAPPGNIPLTKNYDHLQSKKVSDRSS